MTALAMTPEELQARARRTRLLALAHVALALAFLVGFFWAQVHR
ncbi:MAG TPA: hypothetical protein VM240_14555 [Verrucomicrobiae bacterium]|nr:hypothetical protein [Verrucomicrobiae bacterium]